MKVLSLRIERKSSSIIKLVSQKIPNIYKAIYTPFPAKLIKSGNG